MNSMLTGKCVFQTIAEASRTHFRNISLSSTSHNPNPTDDIMPMNDQHSRGFHETSQGSSTHFNLSTNSHPDSDIRH